MSADPKLILEIQAILEALLEATGASRGTLRADDPARGWQADIPAVEVLRHGAPTMLHDGSVNHRAAATIRWIDARRAILTQEDLSQLDPRPPQALMDVYLAKAQMVGPVFQGEHLYGWVSAHDIRHPRPWTADDERAMETAIQEVAKRVF